MSEQPKEQAGEREVRRSVSAPSTSSAWGYLEAYRHNQREYFLFAFALLYVLLCPFTKVEESFHLQATHDILIHGTGWWQNAVGEASDALVDKNPVLQYDHLEFPGVVPRTFLGALFLSALCYPWKILIQMWQMPKVFLLIIVRAALAASVCFSYGRLMNAVQVRLGNRTARAMAWVAIITPHFLFYSSRTLPNTFAVLMMINGFAEWVWMGVSVKFTGYDVYASEAWLPWPLCKCLAWFICAILWFRCDMLVLLGPIVLSMLYHKRATFWQLFRVGVAIGVVALGLTVAVDSYFWRRWLWPEGEVLFFNTVQNRSHEYGVSPWHWYWTSAIPRAMLCTVAVIPVGLVTMTTKRAKTETVKASQSQENSQGNGSAVRPTHPAVQSIRQSDLRPKLPVEWAKLHVETKPQPTTNQSVDFWGRYKPLTFTEWLQRLRVDECILEYFVPAVAFVALYSFLPHKELRFLLPSFPLFHIVIARGLSKLFRFGEALVRGLSKVYASPEVAAAELLADLMENAVCEKVPAVAAFVGTPKAAIQQRREVYTETARMKQNSQSVGRFSSMGGSLNDVQSSVGRLGPSDPVLARIRGDNRETSAPASSTPATDSTPVPNDAINGNNGTATPEITVKADKIDHVSPMRMAFGFCILAFVAGILLVNSLATVLYIRVSMNNYPGGEALQRLYTMYSGDLTFRLDSLNKRQSALPRHIPIAPQYSGDSQLLPPCPWGDVVSNSSLELYRQCVDAKHGCPSTMPKMPALESLLSNKICAIPSTGRAGQVRVHIDVKSAETGVSRFCEAWSDNWIYDKTEGLTNPEQYRSYHFLLTENATFHTALFDVIEVVSSFTHVDWKEFAVRKNIALFIMKRKKE